MNQKVSESLTEISEEKAVNLCANNCAHLVWVSSKDVVEVSFSPGGEDYPQGFHSIRRVVPAYYKINAKTNIDAMRIKTILILEDRLMNGHIVDKWPRKSLESEFLRPFWTAYYGLGSKKEESNFYVNRETFFGKNRGFVVKDNYNLGPFFVTRHK